MAAPTRNVLVVATVAADEPRLRREVARLALPDGTRVHVVSPVSRISPLQWLANEEDAARDEAETIAEETAAAVADATPGSSEVDAEVGDTDPLLAAEDALRTFPADEIVVLVRPEDEASWLERSAVHDGFGRFDLPVRYVVASDTGAAS